MDFRSKIEDFTTLKVFFIGLGSLEQGMGVTGIFTDHLAFGLPNRFGFRLS
jgi:hypothetical protein